MNQQKQTTITYQEQYKDYIESTHSNIGNLTMPWFEKIFELVPKSSKILEIGSTGGRDAKYFRSLGHKVICTDIIEDSIVDLKKSGFESYFYDFRNDPPVEWHGKFDLVFANAVLLHARRDEMSAILSKLSLCLKSKGLIAISLKVGHGEEFSYTKLSSGRYFAYYSMSSFSNVIPNSLEIVFSRVDDSNKWLQLILKLKS